MPNHLPFMDNENETIPEDVQETQNDTVVEETTEELSVEDQLAKAQAEAHKWRRIAQKNQKQATVEEPRITTPELSEELKLIARGLSDEEIEQAKVIAKGKGISLTNAVKEPLFTLFQDKIKDDKKKADAKLGASRGSGETQEDITGVESGSSREEHMKAFKKVNG